MDIDRYFDRFLSYLSINRALAKNTVDGYANDLRSFVDYFADKPLNAQYIFDYIQGYVLKDYKPSTINRKLSAIRAFIRFLSNYEQIDFSYKDIKNIKHRRDLPVYLSFDELKKAFGSDRDGLIVLLMYAGGFRVSELCRMRISEIFFDLGFIKVKGKGSKERMVPVSLDVLKKVEDYIKTERNRFVNDSSSDILFLSKQGRALSRQSVWKLIKKRFLKLGIEIHPHSLRHLFAAHMIENGASLRAVQEMLGHESITTTQIYTDISDSVLEKEFHKLEILN